MVLISGCLEERAGEEVGQTAAALTPVAWTDVVGASAVGNDLTKTAPETAWNAGAASVESLAGDGFVEFTTGEATTDKMAGLSVGNGGQGYQDIDFAIRLGATGAASVWEGGTKRAGIGAYAAGDLFRVQAEGGVVTYHKNGVLKYTSALAPSFPLLVDTSLRTPDATIQNVEITSLVFWQNVVNATADGNDLTNISGPRWRAGASSVESLSGDGYVEFTTGEDTEAKMAGLGSGDDGTGYADIEFAIHLNAASRVSVYESGVYIDTFGRYVPGDVFRVQVYGGVVSYLRNGVELHTSAVAPSFPLVLDTSLRTVGATILDAKLVGGPIGDCSPFQESLPQPGAPNLFMDAAGDVFLLSNPYVGDGSVQVYRRSPTGWTLEQTLSRAGGDADNFGRAIATDGQTIVVAGSNPAGSGSVQVYRFDGAGWVDDGLLTACNGTGFGNSVDVRGDFIAVGSFSNAGFVSGRVNIYRRGLNGWRLTAVLNPSDPASWEWFGYEVAIRGDRLFASAPRNSAQGADVGAIYVYRLDASLPDPGPILCGPGSYGKWIQEAVLYPGAPVVDEFFGLHGLDATSDGLHLIAGDSRRNAARVFAWNGTGWNETAVLRGYPAVQGFGNDVAFAESLDGLAALIGGGDNAYLFAEQGGTWREIDFLEGPAEARYYAAKVAATADTLFLSDESTYAVHVHGLDPTCVAP
ncbi:MAG TPA: FG-GAP repeat protein [Kofleriaceae bacterium]|nr:FG-GAP repeat protein [Kofleriaceae bacterium]